MLLNTYEPWKFAFSQEETDFNNLKEGAWGIIGVPFDSTTSYHPGSRFGPIVVREASYGFEKYNTIFNTHLDNIFYDFGDVNVVFGNCKKTCDIIEDTVNELSDLKIKPLTIGGEHSLTIGVLNSLTKKYGIGIQYKTASSAPPEIQDAIAGKYIEDIMKDVGGDVTKVPIVWYTGNKYGQMSSDAIASNNGLTPQVYQQKWLNIYNTKA